MVIHELDARVGAPLLVMLLMALCGCMAQQADAQASVWKSNHFDLTVPLQGGWRAGSITGPGDTYDRPGELLQGFMQAPELFVYIIKVEADVPLDQLSQEDYIDANRRAYVDHPAYALIEEGDVTLHGRPFHRMRLKAVGTKGPNIMDVHLFRDGQTMISIQWMFPNQGGATIAIPDAITTFNAGVSIGELK